MIDIRRAMIGGPATTCTDIRSKRDSVAPKTTPACQSLHPHASSSTCLLSANCAVTLSLQNLKGSHFILYAFLFFETGLHVVQAYHVIKVLIFPIPSAGVTALGHHVQVKCALKGNAACGNFLGGDVRV